MEYNFYLQDPLDPNTTYLYESIIEQVMRKYLIKWRGIYAFATSQGVRNLFREEPVVKNFLKNNGNLQLLVGVDAITDDKSLKELKELENSYGSFSAKVFMNPEDGLFHPKISHFIYSRGPSVLILGSGNLTSGGLRRNIEAYSIVIGNENELSSLSVWDDFWKRHADNIKDIDETTIERAKKNKQRARQRLKEKIEKEEPIDIDMEEELDLEEHPDRKSGRVLIAHVPKAGGRWHQIHYNKEIVKNFFRMKSNSSQRAILQQIKQDGTKGLTERRPLIYSPSNKNYKIETYARREENYPTSGAPPIIVLREIGTRMFNYMLIMPGENGYAEMLQATHKSTNLGKGLPRVIINYNDLISEWPGCPL